MIHSDTVYEQVLTQKKTSKMSASADIVDDTDHTHTGLFKGEIEN